MKMTPARFIAVYAVLGVRFEMRNGVVVASGQGISPLFAECVARRSKWLMPAMADRLVWQGIQNARRNDAKVKAIKGSRYR